MNVFHHTTSKMACAVMPFQRGCSKSHIRLLFSNSTLCLVSSNLSGCSYHSTLLLPLLLQLLLLLSATIYWILTIYQAKCFTLPNFILIWTSCSSILLAVNRKWECYLTKVTEQNKWKTSVVMNFDSRAYMVLLFIILVLKSKTAQFFKKWFQLHIVNISRKKCNEIILC